MISCAIGFYKMRLTKGMTNLTDEDYSKMSHKFSKGNINHDYFKTWSNNMAYILGFICADGCLYRNSYGSYQLNFAIKSDDIEILEFIKKETGAEHKITEDIKNTNYKENYKSVKLRICNREFGLDLENLGVHQRKSLTIQFPEVPKQYLSHFIRGYFDGDGGFCISKIKKGKYNYLRAMICSGSKDFISVLRDNISNECIDFTPAISNGSAYSIAYTGSRAIKLGDWMYNDATFYLERKYNIWKEFK